MARSGLTSATTIGVTAGLGQHEVEVTPSEAKLIAVVGYSYIRRLVQLYLYLLLLDNLDSFNTLLCVLFLDHHNDSSALRPNLPGPMACSNKLCTGRVRWTLFSFSINLIDIPMLADFIFLEQVD